MNDMPYAGFQHTSSSDAVVTDSAAAGTAFATGVKTYNGAIGVERAATRVTTLLEQAKGGRQGHRAGDDRAGHRRDAGGVRRARARPGRAERDRPAVPRGQRARTSSSAAARTAGSRRAVPGFFPDNPAQDPTEAEPERPRRSRGSGRASLGYDVVHSPEGLRQAGGVQAARPVRERGDVPAASRRAGARVRAGRSLPTMAGKALDVLSSHDEGFFLVLEEEAIDEFEHSDNGRGPAGHAGARPHRQGRPGLRDAARRHPRRGDRGPRDRRARDRGASTTRRSPTSTGRACPPRTGSSPSRARTSSTSWTGRRAGTAAGDVPVTAMGPGAGRFAGVYENTYVHDAMVAALLGTP